MKTYNQFVAEVRPQVKELMPWDLRDLMNSVPAEQICLVDVREPDEFTRMHIQGSLNVPRGILEAACEWGYEETEPELVRARDKHVVVICRSGNRSILAGYIMQLMGYKTVYSLKTGLRGWNDSEEPLVDAKGYRVNMDEGDIFFNHPILPEKMPPKG
jgi:rhodanese-related sulfurtransferase